MAAYDRYGVIGDPVAHSLSPAIHLAFAAQCQQRIAYDRYRVTAEQLPDRLQAFRSENICGLNVTLPLKTMAYQYADVVSSLAEQAGAVSYLHFRDDGVLYGDNLDGMGMVWDLQRRHQIDLKDKRILLAGAGGAVQGVLGTVLVQQPQLVVLANRTISKAERLCERFASDVLTCMPYDALTQSFDVIINGTAASLSGEVPPIPDSILQTETFCYDMMYGRQADTAFIAWAKQQGCQRTADGIGMLVEQNAEIFAVWRGVRPDTQAIYQQVLSAD